jgi:DNA-directed RNA polymerase subunit delta
MRRVIVDYKKLNKEILDLLVDKFPYGYEPEDIITFRNAQNEIIEAVEVRTEDSIYLVKVSKRLADTMENFQDDDNDYDDQAKDSTDTPELSDEDEQPEEDI